MIALRRITLFTTAVLLLLLAETECMSTGKNGDSLTDSSVTSYSTVVIHHPQGKKAVKDSEEGRSETYYKIKQLKTTEQSKIQDFRPSQYFPESEHHDLFKSMESMEDSRNSAQVEYREGKSKKQDSEMKKSKFNNGDRSSEESNWRQNFRVGGRHQIKKAQSFESSQKHEPRKEAKQSGQESKDHLEVLKDAQRIKTEEKSKKRLKHEGKVPVSQAVPSTFRYEITNSIPAIPVELANPFGGFNFHQQRLQPVPPPGMSPELIQTLLSQQPQTFDSDRINSEPKKKSKSQNFKVGYSIGFGGDEIVLGKPKDVHLHVNGRNSVWKTLTNGVEMSTELDKKKPMSEDSAVKASDSVLKNDVYYMNNYKLDTSVPTAGRNTFDHAQALTGSNAFDFSNAVDPGWFQQQPTEQDMAGLYQSFGYPSPLPVYIPGPKGSGAMVQAIVIPMQSLPGIGWPSELASHTLQGNPSERKTLQQIQLQPAPQPVQLQPVAHQPFHLHSAAQRSQLQQGVHQPIQFQPAHHQPMQLQSAAHQPFHLVPVPYAQVIPMQQQHQAILHALSMPLQAQVEQLQPSMEQYQRGRIGKVRDSLKEGTFETSPIVVAAAPSDQAKLQQELNAILADEMKRKNQRPPSVGLRPPHPF